MHLLSEAHIKSVSLTHSSALQSFSMQIRRIPLQMITNPFIFDENSITAWKNNKSPLKIWPRVKKKTANTWFRALRYSNLPRIVYANFTLNPRTIIGIKMTFSWKMTLFGPTQNNKKRILNTKKHSFKIYKFQQKTRAVQNTSRWRDSYKWSVRISLTAHNAVGVIKKCVVNCFI